MWVKLEDYEYNKVGEYWIIDADICEVEQYTLIGETYHKFSYSDDDIIQSSQIQGFRCSVKAFFDKKENIDALGKMIV